MVVYFRTVDLPSDLSVSVPDFPVLVPGAFELDNCLLAEDILLVLRLLKALPMFIFLFFHDFPLVLPVSSLFSDKISFSNEIGIEGSYSGFYCFSLDLPFLPFFLSILGAKLIKKVGVCGF